MSRGSPPPGGNPARRPDGLLEGTPADIETAALFVRQPGPPVSGQFLSSLRSFRAESRREGLVRLAAWSRGAGISAVALEADAHSLIPDLRALGFDDAGPLPCYSSPVRPGWVRRNAPALLLPRARPLENVKVIPDVLPDPAERRLGEQLAPEFGALAGFPDRAPLPAAGVHLVRGGRPLASCRFDPPAAGRLIVPYWIAPPGEPDVTALLAVSALRAAAPAESVWFETPHRLLAQGLFLARFLPRRSRARVLVRQHGDRDLAAPSTSDWHLPSPTVLGPRAVTESGIIRGPTPAGAAIV